MRLGWVIWATRAPNSFADPAEYLRIASSFSHGHTARFFGGGGPSAFWPPGYPAVLAPFVWIAESTGWISSAFVASLVNVVAGTGTIILSGFLAGRWIHPGARAVAAWLVALWPALIFWTSTAHSETVFTVAFLGVLALSTVGAVEGSTRRWLLVGLLVGAAFLIRSPGIIGLGVPALAIRAATGSWRGAARASWVVAVAAALLLVPWTIRNGIQVGIWTPASTNNAMAVCFGHHDRAQTLWNPGELTPAEQAYCLRGSVWDDQRLRDTYEAIGRPPPPGLAVGQPDEPQWYRDSMVNAAQWAVRHPREEARLSILKVWETWSNEGRVVDGARNYAEPGWAGRWQSPLSAAADLWLWVVGAFALVSLVAVPASRRALPIWVPIALVTLAIVGGIAEPHYRHPVVPLVAVLAAGFPRRPDIGVET